MEGSTITSEGDPKLRIQLPKSVEYVGADRWVLYGIADCELHAFVDVDRKKKLERLYWVQFEQYIPTRPELHHTYDSPEHVSIGGLDFYVDSWVRASDEKTEAGSDREHIDELSRRYVGQDYGNPIGPDGRIILVVAPDKVNTPKSLGQR